MRTSIYIDGFNLYYRALRDSPYKWLDLKELATNLLQPHHLITQIKYFSAIVSGIFDPSQPIRQKIYVRALQSHIAEFSVYYGHFLSHEVSFPQAPLTHPPTFTKVVKTEEKGSDVNLAVHLLNDAWLNKYDCAVVISNDSDLAEPLRLVREQHKKNDRSDFPSYTRAPLQRAPETRSFRKKDPSRRTQSTSAPIADPGHKDS